MTLLYNTGIFFLKIGSRIAGVFHPKARAFVTGRQKIFEKLEKQFAGNSAPVVWIHCASLGEFEQGRPIIESIRKEYAGTKILLTFFSPSGYEVRKNFPMADVVAYLPFDTASNARAFIDITKPVLAIFVKYEFWFHFSSELNRRGIPVLSISSIFRKDQWFFKSSGNFFRRILKNFTHFFVQNSGSRDLLRSAGIENITVAGDTRFDRVFEISRSGSEIAVAKAFKSDQKVFVVGSCWSEDLDVLIPFINENRIKFIVAPHEISEAAIATLERALTVPSIRFSRATDAPNLEEYSVLIIDNIGMLSRLYKYGEFAFVGGSFGKGLHNILEAACYGIPIMFGDQNYQKFQEAVDLINRGGAFEVRDYPDLKAKYEMLNVPESFLLACEVTRQYVEENLGATEKIMAHCRQYLKRSPI